MERLRVTGLEKAFGIRTIFSDVSFLIESGDRLGLVGPNGAGKSTLMKCIVGEEEADRGTVSYGDHVDIGYLQQDVSMGDESLRQEIDKAWADIQHLEEKMNSLTKAMEGGEVDEDALRQLSALQERFEWLGGYDYEAKSKRIAFALGFSDSDLDKPASAFSGGQRTRINLARALVRMPDFLFLDEPTNHLDMEMIEWLENFLLSYRGGILVISHDRYFLNRVTTGIVELSNEKVQVYKGNYDSYHRQKKAQDKANAAAYEKQQAYIEKTEAYIDKYRAGRKAKMARGRQSQLNRLERIEAPTTEVNLDFSFPPAPPCADRVLELDDLESGYGKKSVFSHLTASIRRGESVGLIGSNGAGKSTLVETIMGDIHAWAGEVRIGNRVQVGYFSQEHDELHDQWTVCEEVQQAFAFSEDKARKVLGSFLFRGDEVFRKVGELSGGERARLCLLLLFLQGNNFLILDEPTNHLDIPTREVIERALCQFDGTVLVISHDRYFLNAVAKRIWYLTEGHIEDYLGNYDYVKSKRKELALDSTEPIDEATGPVKEASLSPERALHVPKKQQGGAKAKEKLSKVETEIARLEATMKMYEVQLEQSTMAGDIEAYGKLAEEMKAVEETLGELYETWEELMA